MEGNTAILELKNVDKVYHTHNGDFYALRGVNLKINESELLIILGQSGSGKSTLMNITSGLDQATSGSVFFRNKDITHYSDIELERYRRDEIGFVFQTYNLIPNLKIGENIELCARLGKGEEKVDYEDLLKEFDLTQYRDKFPYELSGGGKQRVAIARALSKKPNLLMCDEPTGALDENNAIKILKKLQEYNEKYRTTIVVITHNPIYAKAGHRAIYISSGSIVKEVVNSKITDADKLQFGEFFGGAK